jgi:hypothetical protein
MAINRLTEFGNAALSSLAGMIVGTIVGFFLPFYLYPYFLKKEKKSISAGWILLGLLSLPLIMVASAVGGFYYGGSIGFNAFIEFLGKLNGLSVRIHTEENAGVELAILTTQKTVPTQTTPASVKPPVHLKQSKHSLRIFTPSNPSAQHDQSIPYQSPSPR